MRKASAKLAFYNWFNGFRRKPDSFYQPTTSVSENQYLIS